VRGVLIGSFLDKQKGTLETENISKQTVMLASKNGVNVSLHRKLTAI
jgi:hypothetical protein